MPYRDMRAFLDRLEAEGQLARVRRPGPDALRDRRGHPPHVGHRRAGPLVRGRHRPRHARRRLALRRPAQGAPGLRGGHAGRGQRSASSTASTSPIPPRIVGSGPCQEVVLTGDDVDLFRCPCRSTARRTAAPTSRWRSRSAPIPMDGGRNASIYRLMRVDRNHLAVMSHVFQGLGTHIAQAEELRPGRSTWPSSTASIRCSCTRPRPRCPHGFFEIDIAGGINGAPVEMVPCKTIDLACRPPPRSSSRAASSRASGCPRARSASSPATTDRRSSTRSWRSPRSRTAGSPSSWPASRACPRPTTTSSRSSPTRASSTRTCEAVFPEVTAVSLPRVGRRAVRGGRRAAPALQGPGAPPHPGGAWRFARGPSGSSSSTTTSTSTTPRRSCGRASRAASRPRTS